MSTVLKEEQQKEASSVNDCHSAMNESLVYLEQPRDREELKAILAQAQRNGRAISICGRRHAMGGQQFCNEELLVDTSTLNRVLELKEEEGLLRVEGGITWPEIHDYLRAENSSWTFRQKQTGADFLSIGGALSANVHGRGLALQPFIQDVETFVLLTTEGEKCCSRTHNKELFALVIGGYGLFGIILEVTLRLSRRSVMRRDVQITTSDALMEKFNQVKAEGYEYGDFQFCCEPESDDFLHRGVFSCYKTEATPGAEPLSNIELGAEQWKKLLYLAHVDKQRAFDEYARHYLRTDGQTYWSDEMQMGTYIDDYHKELDVKLGASCRGSEMITEVYVPQVFLEEFLKQVRHAAREQQMHIIYGTIRLIEKDTESFLPWAKQQYACIIFNLHVDHCPSGFAKVADDFRRLIDIALGLGGSFYLTYHRFATKSQILQAYPQFVSFLKKKKELDARETFQSNWYQHYLKMFSEELSEDE